MTWLKTLPDGTPNQILASSEDAWGPIRGTKEATRRTEIKRLRGGTREADVTQIRGLWDASGVVSWHRSDPPPWPSPVETASSAATAASDAFSLTVNDSYPFEAKGWDGWRVVDGGRLYLDAGTVERVARGLELKWPITMTWTKLDYPIQGLRLGTIGFEHEIEIGAGLNCLRTSEVIWHELGHCVQAELEPNGSLADVKERIGKGALEQEARSFESAFAHLVVVRRRGVPNMRDQTHA